MNWKHAGLGLVLLMTMLVSCGESHVEYIGPDDETAVAQSALVSGGQNCWYVIECLYPPIPGDPYSCGPLPPGAVVLPDGTIVVDENAWAGGGPYQVISHQCHHAANDGCDADENGSTGILSCDGFSSGPYGHTVNWTFIPTDHCGSGHGQICLTEPQTPGAAACCWDTTGFVGSTPNVTGREAQACLAQLCGDNNSPTAFACDFRWDTSADDPGHCADTSWTPEDCNHCCHNRANQCVWPEYADDKEDWLSQCLAACAGP